MSQHDRIKAYMKEFGSISPMEAFTELGITKLSTRIGEMVRKGERIYRKQETSRNRYGEKVTYMRYYLK